MLFLQTRQITICFNNRDRPTETTDTSEVTPESQKKESKNQHQKKEKEVLRDSTHVSNPPTIILPIGYLIQT
jgi:hypothetical protein